MNVRAQLSTFTVNVWLTGSKSQFGVLLRIHMEVLYYVNYAKVLFIFISGRKAGVAGIKINHVLLFSISVGSCSYSCHSQRWLFLPSTQLLLNNSSFLDFWVYLLGFLLLVGFCSGTAGKTSGIIKPISSLLNNGVKIRENLQLLAYKLILKNDY